MEAVRKSLSERRLEAICRHGCRQVWQIIETLEQGGDVAETADLDVGERAWLLAELKAVMAVYGERCRVD